MQTNCTLFKFKICFFLFYAPISVAPEMLLDAKLSKLYECLCFMVKLILNLKIRFVVVVVVVVVVDFDQSDGGDAKLSNWERDKLLTRPWHPHSIHDFIIDSSNPFNRLTYDPFQVC